MNYIKTGIEKAKEIRSYWNTPAKGNYMPFKEIMAYSVGGFGAYSIFTMAQALLLSTTNVIIGNTIGIQPMHMYVMYLISVVTNIPLTMVRANMVDNVRYKEGKYRPYLLRMGIPTVAISLLFVFTPYAGIPYLARCALIFVYNFGLQFFYNFFYDAYENLIHVLSPNSQERTNVTAIKSMIYSLSPTVTNFVTPLIAKKVADGNIYDLRVYQWLYPFIAVSGVALIILVYARTEEKIVVAKTHQMKIRFTDALREVAKNKYFWIISLAGWLGFLETCTYVILQWLYNYAHLCTEEQYAFITLIRGTAYVWGMVLAPFAIKKWGKKRVLIATNLFNIGFLALVYPLMGSIWTVLLCMYFNSIADSFMLVLNPAIQADIRDYQQYKSGERIDGMFGAVAMIGSFVTMATSSVLPAVYEKYGIYSGNGYENMYDILYNLPTLYKLVGVLVILSALGAALNVFPYFFYDLTETKQKAIIKILQIRAMFEDYGNGVLTDEDMVRTMTLIREEKEILQRGGTDLAALKKERAPKSRLKQAAAQNEEYEIAGYVLQELERFSRPEEQMKLAWARGIVDAGVEGVADIGQASLEEARRMPAGTHGERLLRKEAIACAKAGLRSQKAMMTYYPEGVVPFDEDKLSALYETEAALAEEKRALLAGQKDRAALRDVNARQKENAAAIKALQQERQRYTESTKVYADAEKLVRQAENYARFGEIDARFADMQTGNPNENAEA
ncbi:MAG: MFS transporter [Clostridia bacterium]|nr:MFS transporter [Clostridia bacterium]